MGLYMNGVCRISLKMEEFLQHFRRAGEGQDSRTFSLIMGHLMWEYSPYCLAFVDPFKVARLSRGHQPHPEDTSITLKGFYN